MTGTDLKLTAVNLADGTAVAPRRGVVQRAPAVVGNGGGRVARQARPAAGVGCAGPPYEYEGAAREILAAARADLDAEEAAAASEPAPEPEPADVAAVPMRSISGIGGRLWQGRGSLRRLFPTPPPRNRSLWRRRHPTRPRRFRKGRCPKRGLCDNIYGMRTLSSRRHAGVPLVVTGRPLRRLAVPPTTDYTDYRPTTSRLLRSSGEATSQPMQRVESAGKKQSSEAQRCPGATSDPHDLWRLGGSGRARPSGLAKRLVGSAVAQCHPSGGPRGGRKRPCTRSRTPSATAS